MKYSNFIKILNNKDIYLFDHEYRISYFNIVNNLNSNLNSNNQVGGGKYNFLNNKSKDDLLLIINIANSSNPHNLFYFLK